jgi:hypothetical protein
VLRSFTHTHGATEPRVLILPLKCHGGSRRGICRGGNRLLREIQQCSTSAALASKATAGNTERSNDEPSKEVSFLWLQNTFLTTKTKYLSKAAVFVLIVILNVVVIVMVVVVVKVICCRPERYGSTVELCPRLELGDPASHGYAP